LSSNVFSSCQPETIGEVDHTLQYLVPKCDVPSNITQFRHIALYNVIYKVVTKVITQRLESILPYISAPSQSSFVLGRLTCDNILVRQETIHSLNNLHCKKGYMILKFDLEKANDWLEWGFLLDILFQLGLPNNLIKLIDICISSASFSINWNGSTTNSFHSSRDLC
jgi:hypothetical protein